MLVWIPNFGTNRSPESMGARTSGFNPMPPFADGLQLPKERGKRERLPVIIEWPVVTGTHDGHAAASKLFEFNV